MGDRDKTAVVIIHGVGEQRPMDTLWGFIDAAWLNDPDLVEPFQKFVYSKPGATENNHELRRVTTRGDKNTGRSFDFHEYYWAHMFRGNTLSDVKGWLFSMFFRPRSQVPPEYHNYWWAGWGLAALVIAAYLGWLLFSHNWSWWAAALGLVVPPITSAILSKAIPIVGDAARYLQPNPGNVEARQRIRAEGMALLKRLQDSGEYDRIVMVGHSLGSVVAYDILTHCWGQLDTDKLKAQHADDADLMAALTHLEKVGAELLSMPDGAERNQMVDAWRNAQRNYRRALAGQAEPLWLVSDLVTLGSPLGKADILLSKSAEQFETRKERREFPTCPPKYEFWAQNVKQFSYPRAGKTRIPHHGSPFGPTVWSNAYFPTQWLVLGDPIAGAVGPHFGPGIVDHKLPNKPLRFQHLDYWAQGEDAVAKEAIAALRKALNLRDLDDGETTSADDRPATGEMG